MRLKHLLLTYLVHPRQLALRRVVFQIHRWMGLGLGIYLLVMSLTGATLVWEEEILAWRYPHLYHVRGPGSAQVDMDALIAAVRSNYQNRRIWQIEAPTTTRDTYVLRVEANGAFRVVFAHPGTGEILGELPKDTLVSPLKRIHENLYFGAQGRRVNCTIGLFVLLLAATGLFVWWPGVRRAWSALGVTWTGGWRRITTRLHAAVGFWTFAFVVMFAATGAYFYFDSTIYRLLGGASPQSNPPSPRSNPALSGPATRPNVQQLIARAVDASPDKRLWGLFPPWSAEKPIQIVLGPVGPDSRPRIWDWHGKGQRFMYFDQYTGELLQRWDLTNPTFADFVRSWAGPLHRGSFGGTGIKALWIVVGLAPAFLFIAGVMMWWGRVMGPWLRRRFVTAGELDRR